MKKQLMVIPSILFIITFCLVENSFSGSANLTIINEKDSVNVVKYVVRFGSTEQVDPENYPSVVEIIPDDAALVKSNINVNVGDGKSGNYYFSVKDVYSNGDESKFSESSFPMYIPRKPTNLKIK